jgi:hypothetical protein
VFASFAASWGEVHRECKGDASARDGNRKWISFMTGNRSQTTTHKPKSYSTALIQSYNYSSRRTRAPPHTVPQFPDRSHCFYPGRTSFDTTPELHAKAHNVRDNDTVGYIGSWYMQVLKSRQASPLGMAPHSYRTLVDAWEGQG